MNAEGKKIPDISEVKLAPADKWIISKLQNCIREVTTNLNKYELGVAADIVTDFVWDDFCDWYIELSKPYLYGTDENKKSDVLSVLIYVLKNTLKLLHPYIPFITEEIYQHIPGVNESIMISEYPRYNSKLAYRKEAEDCRYVMSVITAIRQIRADTGCAPSKTVDLYIVTEKKRLIEKASIYIEKLANIGAIKFIENKDEIGVKTVSVVLDKTELYIPLGELVDIDKEVVRLKGELEKVESEIARANGKLSNNGFLAKAPKALVDQEREKLNKYLDMRKKIKANIKEILG
jgi:valyl-tRNA synthetase